MPKKREEAQLFPVEDFEVPAFTSGRRPADSSSKRPKLVGNKRISIGGALNKAFVGINPMDYADVTPAALQAIKAARVGQYLFSDTSTAAFNGVVLNGVEYDTLVRSPRSLSAAVAMHHRALAEKKGKVTTATKSVSAAMQAEKRSVDAMENVRSGIRSELSVVTTLAKESKTPGYAHIPAQELGSHLALFSTVYVPNILNVVGIEKDWTKERRELAGKAAVVAFFLQEPQERVRDFSEWAELDISYAHARDVVFTQSINATQKQINADLARLDVPRSA